MLKKCQRRPSLRFSDFLAANEVFTVEDADRFLVANKSGNTNTRSALLTYYRQRGKITLIRRGLYAVVPHGIQPETFFPDPFIVAAKMCSDAVLAYHTALEFHGRAYSLYKKHYFVSVHPSLRLSYNDFEIYRVSPPAPLFTKRYFMFGVELHHRGHSDIRVTSLERTFVDILDRPNLSGSWEEIWKSLESVEFFDLEQVEKYLRLLDNATTTAKVGFFLEQHQEPLMVDKSFLKRLQKHIPQQAHYIERKKRMGCRLVKQWNLLVPDEILEQTWEEPQ
ncbi:MAG: hypothetical protein LBQ50_12445 [Planctomycetaceae bacterium]|jgi:predicted transcriptional regulator of viral defense system|nr:hypothetical protein [Planctomycetaceae bacterium]